MPSRTLRISAASDPIPSPKRPTSLAASARFLLTAWVPPLVGIATPRTRFRELRRASAAPPAKPASPAPAASAGTFAFLDTSPSALPAFLTPSLTVPVARATTLFLDAEPLERELEFCRLDARDRDAREDDRVVRRPAVERDPFEPDLFLGLELDREARLVDELLVCCAISPSSPLGT
jgi:hypothetical protein